MPQQILGRADREEWNWRTAALGRTDPAVLDMFDPESGRRARAELNKKGPFLVFYGDDNVTPVKEVVLAAD